jgi:uncharacterized coiled-coil protein SlyX
VLDRLVRLYEQQSSDAAALEKTRTRRVETARLSQAWTRFSDPPPYSILLPDRIREDSQAERQRIRSGEAAVAVLNELIEENRRVLAQAEEQLRQLNEQLESAQDPALRARLSWQREYERLRSQAAAASVAVLDTERLCGQEALAEGRIRLSLLERQLVLAEAGARFTQADLDQQTARIELERQQLDREFADAVPRLAAASRNLGTAREELRLAQTGANPDAATPKP